MAASLGTGWALVKARAGARRTPVAQRLRATVPRLDSALQSVVLCCREGMIDPLSNGDCLT